LKAGEFRIRLQWAFVVLDLFFKIVSLYAVLAADCYLLALATEFTSERGSTIAG
jgi:hypothetical protein